MNGATIDADVVILGSGPHGLAVALHLLEAAPQRRQGLRVVDPSGRWLDAWTRRFHRLDIDELRSPAVHHPGTDPAALHQRLRAKDRHIRAEPYLLPPADAFEEFCDELAERAGLTTAEAGGPLVRASVQDVALTRRDALVSTSVGVLRARHVVVATNPHRRVLPDWLAAVVPTPLFRLRHADDIDLRGEDGDVAGERIAVIGGGLTAAHLAVGAVRRGAAVELITRRPLRVGHFDVDPAWLGPRRLEPFHAEPDPSRRLALALEARGGGSMPPGTAAVLEGMVEDGAVRIHEAGLRRAGRHGERFELTPAGGDPCVVDRIWLATGTLPCLSAARFLMGSLLDIPTIGEVPVPGRDLRLGPWPLFITGRLATVELGPAAGNLWGARQAALAITRAITGVDLELARPRRPPRSPIGVRPSAAG